MAASRVVLHIGYGKTGTTAIQNFLSLNRPSLSTEGICYPDLRHRRVNVGITNHNWFAWAVIGKIGWINMNDAAMLRHFDSQVAMARAHTLLLSAEALALEPHPWLFERTEQFWGAQKAKLDRLQELFSNREVRIIAYLRRQDLWVESAINHSLRLQGLSPRPAAQDIDQFLAAIAPCLDYAAVLDLWAAAFGKEAIEVAPYEPGQLAGSSVVSDFRARLDLPPDGRFREPEWTTVTKNSRLPRDLLELKRILNGVRRPKYEERFLVRTLHDIAAELPSTPHDYAPLLPATHRQSLLEACETSNRTVAQEYLGREDGVLFREPRRETQDVEAYPGLSAERAVELYLRVRRRRNSFAGRRQVLVLRLKESLRQRSPALHAVARAMARRLPG